MSTSRRRRRSGLGLSPDLRAIVDSLSDEPALRAAAYEVATALDSPDMLDAYCSTEPVDRARLLLAMRHALDGLVLRKPCDFCPGRSRRIRFVFVRPDDPGLRDVLPVRDANAFSAFAILCGRCGELSEHRLRAKLLGKYKDLRDDLGHDPPPFHRETLLGRRVGEVEHLPPGRDLQACSTCGASIWIDPELRVGGDREEPVCLCPACFSTAAAAGRLECLPAAFIVS